MYICFTFYEIQFRELMYAHTGAFTLVIKKVRKAQVTTAISSKSMALFSQNSLSQTGYVECGFHEEVKCHQRGIRVFIVYR